MVAAGKNTLDYSAFLDIGHRFLDGTPIWVGNSYYLLPMVLIFALFALLPSTFAFLLWHLASVLFALWITKGSPWVLLFAPLFAHTLSGQSAVFGLVGVWLYSRFRTKPIGGLGLALMLLKPQLGILPLLWAIRHWKWKQMIMAGVTTLVIWLPSFILMPNWVLRWLGNSRSIDERVLSAIFPRLLLIVFGPPPSLVFWILLAPITFGLFLFMRSRLVTFKRWIVAGILVLPSMNDYDLIQLIAVLDKRTLPVAAIASIPTWIVIFAAYGNDHAWITATLIPIALFVYSYWRKRLLFVNGSAHTI